MLQLNSWTSSRSDLLYRTAKNSAVGENPPAFSVSIGQVPYSKACLRKRGQILHLCVGLQDHCPSVRNPRDSKWAVIGSPYC